MKMVCDKEPCSTKVWNDDKCTFMDNVPFTLCLKQETEYLKCGRINLLVDPRDIYISDNGDKWLDFMASLNDDTDMDSKSTSHL